MNGVLKLKNMDMINNNVLEVIEQFALKGEYRLLGSNSLRAIHYASDYDVATNITRSSPAYIAKELQKQFKLAYRNKDIWITDFKCGWDDRLLYDGDGTLDNIAQYLANHPMIPKSQGDKIMACPDKDDRIDKIKALYILRWTLADMNAGKKRLVDGTFKRLEDCIMDLTTMKIDLVARVGERFIELSENYYVTYRGESNYDKSLSTKQAIIKSLESQISEYAEKDKLKSLKRLFSLMRIEGGNNEKKVDKKAMKLVDFFNSETGFLGKIKNEIGIIELLMEQKFRPVEWSVIYDNLQLIKEEIANVYQIALSDDFFEMINKMKPTTAPRQLQIIKAYFMEKINESSGKFMKTL